MSEKEFWKSTFREIMSLIRIHNDINSGKSKNNKPKKFIDEVF